jgi:hypothetical protein
MDFLFRRRSFGFFKKSGKDGKHPEKIRKERQLPARRPSRILPRLLRSKKRYPQKL